MRISGFVIAIDSYLVRKGVISLLNRLQGVKVMKEFDGVGPLLKHMKTNGTEFLIVSQFIFDQATELYVSNPGLLERTIVVMPSHTPRGKEDLNTFISLSEGKEELTKKILGFLELRHVESGQDTIRELSQREVTIVRLVSKGLTNKQIAGELFLSPHTVSTHRKNITRKLGIKSVSGLTVYAIVNNIITMEEVVSKPSE